MVFDMEISDYETHTLFLGALQYGFGRMSYYPGLIQSFIKKHWKELPENTKERIIYFTKDAIETNDKFADKDYKLTKSYYLGSIYDVESWKNFYVWCHENFKGE